jgi:hypothetical protein
VGEVGCLGAYVGLIVSRQEFRHLGLIKTSRFISAYEKTVSKLARSLGLFGSTRCDSRPTRELHSLSIFSFAPTVSKYLPPQLPAMLHSTSLFH